MRDLVVRVSDAPPTESWEASLTVAAASGGQTVPGGEGFMSIESDVDIDVVAVYTAQSQTATRDGLGTSIDVEYIKPKNIQ